MASDDLVRWLRMPRPKSSGPHSCEEAADALEERDRTIERLERELDSERKMHAIAKSFHDVAVQQRDSAWQASERLERELAEARKEAARERGWRKIAQQRLKRANLPEPEWPIDAAKEGE